MPTATTVLVPGATERETGSAMMLIGLTM